ncbi:MAG: hypothetical protein H0T53_09960 [Herpetosiphonaceae bacterium]|nr:hypothetical protein [Herpetosiphonaceae bacterium]
MSDQEETLVHEHDLEPDPEPEEIPTAILEQDEDSAPSGMLLQTVAFALGVFMILLLLLYLASGGRILNFGSDGINTNPNSERTPILTNNMPGGAGGSNTSASSASSTLYDLDGLGSLPDYASEIAPEFLPYWLQHGGERIFGRPLPQPTPLLEENGRKFQWFERARLELWPEYAATKYLIQPGRIGTEFTKGVEFPTQQFFVNRPGLVYEEVTQHGLRGEFLKFWQENGGVDIFGYPISDELQVILPEDRAYHTVQYFERARFELHPNDPNQPVKLGLLGTGLYMQELKPNLDPIKPTAVPLTP